MHKIRLAMTTLRVVRRPDGVIELRRRHFADSRFVKDAALLVGLCIVCLGFIAALAAVLVESPMLLAATAALVLPVVPAILLARSADLAPAPARSRGPTGPDGAA
jgi:hypothetical protein